MWRTRLLPADNTFPFSLSIFTSELTCRAWYRPLEPHLQAHTRRQSRLQTVQKLIRVEIYYHLKPTAWNRLDLIGPIWCKVIKFWPSLCFWSFTTCHSCGDVNITSTTNFSICFRPLKLPLPMSTAIMSRPQVSIDRLTPRRVMAEPRESMNCKSCRKRKVCLWG